MIIYTSVRNKLENLFRLAAASTTSSKKRHIRNHETVRIHFARSAKQVTRTFRYEHCKNKEQLNVFTHSI